MLLRHSVGIYQGNKLTSNLSGKARPQSSQFTEPLWTDPGLKSGTGVHELISTSKNPHNERKKPPPLFEANLYLSGIHSPHLPSTSAIIFVFQKNTKIKNNLNTLLYI